MRLTATGLTHRFPGQDPLFRELDLAVEPGSMTALTGPSGSGKTTLLTLLAGWVTPVAGDIDRDGVRRIVWVSQNPHGVPQRTALDHVVLPLLARGFPRPDAERQAQELLSRFRLA